MAVFDKFTGIGVASGFKLQAKAPLDGRLVVDTIEDRNALVIENGAYEGMKVYVKSVGISYVLTGTTNSDWKADGIPVVEDTNGLDTITENSGAYDGMMVCVGKSDIYTFDEQNSTWEGQSDLTLNGFFSNGYAGIDEVTQGLIDIKEFIAGSEAEFNTSSTGDSILTRLDDKLSTSDKGTAGGVAELDNTGKVPSSQLPSYVDDVIEGYFLGNEFWAEASAHTKITGENGKIYVDLSTNKTYRWSGTAFVEISSSLALGETSSSAYRGDRGKIAYDHSQAAHAPANAERNVIVGVQKNGTDITPDANRKINIEIPTNVSDLINDEGFVKSTGTVEAAKYLSNTYGLEGVDYNGTSNVSHYCICSTAAATAAKESSDISGFNLMTGARVIVKFTVTNTAANPTLDIDGSGAKAIVYRGAAIQPGAIMANHTYEFVYNGTSYEIVGDLDTTYMEATTSKTGLMSAEDKAKVDASAVVVFSAEEPTDIPPGGLWMQIE